MPPSDESAGCRLSLAITMMAAAFHVAFWVYLSSMPIGSFHFVPTHPQLAAMAALCTGTYASTILAILINQTRPDRRDRLPPTEVLSREFESRARDELRTANYKLLTP
jgi:hypothetical protein